MSRLGRIIKIIAINLALIVTGVLILETGYRSIKYLASCTVHCDSNFFRLSPIEGNLNIGLTVFDPALGFVPRPYFDSIINQPSWNRANVTITADGYRSNNDQTTARLFEALAIGDSFTFGNQVSNTDTWPSCLEREGKITIANAGVPGYGAAQAVLRGKIEVEKHQQITLIIWSILVDEDFSRDRLQVHSGFIKPTIIRTQGQTRQVPPPPNNNARHRQYFEPEKHASIVLLVKIASHLYIFDILSSYLDLSERVNLIHPQAAPIEKVIDFAFDEFSALPVKNKLVILQYSRRAAYKAASAEHDRLLEAAKARGLPLLDTKNAVTHMEPEKVWDGHHTPLGNQLVCRAILDKLATP